MATIVQVVGTPGSGKTFSTKNLNPKETFYLDVDSKGLAWAGWRNDYNAANKNYYCESDIDKIKSYIAGIIKTKPHIKLILVDTISTIFGDFLQKEKNTKGYDMWRDLAADCYSLYSFCNKQIPPSGIDDVIIVFFAHIESFKAVDPLNGMETMAIRTAFPSKSATKQQLSKFLSYNIMTVVDMNEEPENRYKFRTQTTGADEVRSVYGVLPFMMPNNLAEVIRLIREKDLCLPIENNPIPTT